MNIIHDIKLAIEVVKYGWKMYRWLSAEWKHLHGSTSA